MRDDDASRDTTHPLPLAVMVQPDPMLEERPARPLQIIATALGATVIVIMVLYGLTRPAGQQEMAATSEQSQTAPAGGGAANNAGGQAQPANAPAQNPQANAQQPTTTGQSSGQQGSRQPKTPPAAGGSATSTGPGAKPAPEAR